MKYFAFIPVENKIGDDGAIEIAEALKFNSLLKHLYFGGYKFLNTLYSFKQIIRLEMREQLR